MVTLHGPASVLILDLFTDMRHVCPDLQNASTFLIFTYPFNYLIHFSTKPPSMGREPTLSVYSNKQARTIARLPTWPTQMADVFDLHSKM